LPYWKKFIKALKFFPIGQNKKRGRGPFLFLFFHGFFLFGGLRSPPQKKKSPVKKEEGKGLHLTILKQQNPP